ALEVREGETEEAIGTGDQGIMFGYACDETEEIMPLPIFLAHRLAKQLTDVRKDTTLVYIRPDGKTQDTIEYDENDQTVRVNTVVISTQHHRDISNEQIEKDIREHVIEKVIPSFLLDETSKLLINPSGRFVIGGPQGDAGLTGRKII